METNIFYQVRSFRRRVLGAIEGIERVPDDEKQNEKTMFILISIFIVLALLVAFAMGACMILSHVEPMPRT